MPPSKLSGQKLPILIILYSFCLLLTYKRWGEFVRPTKLAEGPCVKTGHLHRFCFSFLPLSRKSEEIKEVNIMCLLLVYLPQGT